MKKQILVAFGILIIFAGAGCNSDLEEIALTDKATATTSTINNTKITKEDAIRIVRNAIGDDEGNRKIELDGDLREIDQRYYYLVHAFYTDMSFTYTYGWYYVDQEEGIIYVEDITSEDKILLIPYEEAYNG